MNKICTSIEQSKKLIEFGIDINTADMHYNNLSITHGSDYVNDFNAELMNYNSAVKLLTKYIHNPLFEIIPAWSLSALLELIPPYLGEFKDGIDFGFSKAMNGKWYSAHYIKINDNGLATFSKTITGDTAIDAAFEMVCWLKENGKI